jgi:ubiquinol-cytochrome c reductase cytochrome b subunit
MIPTTIGMAGFLSAEFRGRKRHERRWSPAVAAGVVLAVLVLGAAITGYRLPWGSVALWAVKVPTHVAGYRFVFGPAARFVLMGRTEVSKPTLWRWFVVHTVVLPLLVLGALTILWRTRRGRPTPLPGGDSLDAPVQPGR